MSAHGGDPEAMTVSQYLDLAYAVVVDERVRRGESLFDALESASEWAAKSDLETAVVTAGGNTYQPSTPERVDPGGPGAPVTPEEIANAQSFETFQAAMKAVSGGPG